MQNRAQQQPYMVRYQDAHGRVLTGFTVRGEQELAAAFTEMAHRPEITLTWRTWTGLSVDVPGEPDPWRTKDELPHPPAPPADHARRDVPGAVDGFGIVHSDADPGL